MVFTNGMMNMLGVGDKDLTLLLNEIKAMGVQIVPVGIGECPKVSELEKIASSNIAPLCFGEYQSSITLGKSIIQGNKRALSFSPLLIKMARLSVVLG